MKYCCTGVKIQALLCKYVSVHPLTSFCIPPTLKRSDTHDTFENAVQGEIFENGSVYYIAGGQTNGSFSGVDRENVAKTIAMKRSGFSKDTLFKRFFFLYLTWLNVRHMVSHG